MKKQQILPVILLAVLCMTLAGCGHKVELGKDTLLRIDEINSQLDRGILQVAPETRALIDELNQTIANGLKVGFDEATLKRVDRLLERIEKGIKIEGKLGPKTIETLNRMIDEIDAAPEKWEEVAKKIIRTLEGLTIEVTKQMTSEIEMLMQEARVNSQQIIATSGTEFRCNADFLENKLEVNAQELIGRGLIGRLKAIITGDDTEPVVPSPWVCQIIPDQIDLVEVGEAFVAEKHTQVIRITGYNFVPDNLPEAYMEYGVGESHQRIDSIRLSPRWTTPYQIMLNLQEIDDFGTVPAGSWLVFRWPDGRDHSIVVLLPIPEQLEAELEIVKDEVSVYRGPDTRYYLASWRMQKGAKYEVLGQYGTWFKIRDKQDPTLEGWIQDEAEAVLRNEATAPLISVPSLLPEAIFECSPRQGYSEPLSVTCEATKTVGDLSGWEWIWDFGDGSRTESGNPVTHEYHRDGIFDIELKLKNKYGRGTASSQANHIIVNKIPPPPEALFTASPQEGEVPLTVKLTNNSKGNWEYLEWDFGDGDTSSKRSRVVDHTFDAPGTYEVKLMVWDDIGQRSEWTVPIIVDPKAKIHPRSIAFYRYRGLSSKHFDATPNDDIEQIRYNTGWNDQDVKCGIVGFKVQGILPEPSGGIWGDVANMDVYMETDTSGDWWINASLEVKYETQTKRNERQSWDIDTLCIGNSVFDRGGAKYLSFSTLSGNLEFNEAKQVYFADTGISVDGHHCGVVGFSFKDAIYTPNPRYVFEAHAVKDRNWRIETSFQDLSIPEQTKWTKVNGICLVDDPSIDIKFGQAGIPYESTGYYWRPIDLTGENYRCGVFGMSAKEGRLDTSDEYRKIVEARMTIGGDDVWTVWAGFPSDGPQHNEKWKLDWFCLNNKYVTWDISYDCSSKRCYGTP